MLFPDDKTNEFSQVLNELITTENHYIIRLHTVQDKIIKPLLNDRIFTDNELDIQFHSWDRITNIHEQFYKKIQRIQSFDCLLGFIQQLKVYKSLLLNSELASLRRSKFLDSNSTLYNVNFVSFYNSVKSIFESMLAETFQRPMR